MSTITIFHAEICGLCHKALDYFKGRGIAVDAREVHWDGAADSFVDSPNAREMYLRCGKKVDFVPQIFIGDVHVAGWKKLEPMIVSGELEGVLEGVGRRKN